MNLRLIKNEPEIPTDLELVWGCATNAIEQIKYLPEINLSDSEDRATVFVNPLDTEALDICQLYRYDKKVGNIYRNLGILTLKKQELISFTFQKDWIKANGEFSSELTKFGPENPETITRLASLAEQIRYTQEKDNKLVDKLAESRRRAIKR